MKKKNELSYRDLKMTCDTNLFHFETTEELAVHHEKLIEQIIQQIKIDMYKDKYKAYGTPMRLIFMPKINRE